MENPNTSPSLSTVGPAQVGILRFSLFTGVAIFGAACWFVTRDQPLQALTDDFDIPMYAFFALLAIATIVAVTMKRKQADSMDWGKRVTYGIIGWAACEGYALFGGVYWLMSGDPRLYVIGALMLVASLVLLAPKQVE